MIPIVIQDAIIDIHGEKTTLMIFPNVNTNIHGETINVIIKNTLRSEIVIRITEDTNVTPITMKEIATLMTYSNTMNNRMVDGGGPIETDFHLRDVKSRVLKHHIYLLITTILLLPMYLNFLYVDVSTGKTRILNGKIINAKFLTLKSYSQITPFIT